MTENIGIEKKITFNILKFGFLIIILTYIIMLIINYNASKEFNFSSLDKEVKLLFNNGTVYNKSEIIQKLNHLKTNDRFISYIEIDNEIIYSDNTDYLFDYLFSTNNHDILIKYDDYASTLYTHPLMIRMAGVTLAFLILVFVLSFHMNKLFSPFEEFISYMKFFDFQNLKPVSFNSKFISKEFKLIEDSFNKIVNEFSIRNKKIEELAFHDYLTGLKNRFSLEKNISLKIKNNIKFSFIFLDLDDFKLINDTLGHIEGDKLLLDISNILSKNKIFEAYRLGGDEFVILIDSIDKNFISSQLSSLLYQINSIKINEFIISSSIGISSFPLNGKSFENLLQCSDIAMYNSKENGKNIFSFYKPKMKDELYEIILLENDLKSAIKNDEFILHLQPQIDSLQNKVISAETLVRWEHPKKGLIFPNNFINFLENSNLIYEFGLLIIEKSIIYMKNINNKSLYNLEKISINISGKQFDNPNFFSDVKHILIKTKCNPKCIEFEITERVLSNNKNIGNIIQEFKDIGISFSIDDFGIGESSLSILNTLPIDKIKIDKSFIDELIITDSMVGFIIDLSNHLNLNIIAEGVEKFEQVKILQEKGCYYIQGYYYSKPLKIDDFIDFLNITNSKLNFNVFEKDELIGL